MNHRIPSKLHRSTNWSIWGIGLFLLSVQVSVLIHVLELVMPPQSVFSAPNHYRYRSLVPRKNLPNKHLLKLTRLGKFLQNGIPSIPFTLTPGLFFGKSGASMRQTTRGACPLRACTMSPFATNVWLLRAMAGCTRLSQEKHGS